MKKNILIFCTALLTLSLMAFGYLSRNNTSPDQKAAACSKAVATNFHPLNAFDLDIEDTDLFYNVAPRFMTTVTREDLNNATSVIDIFPRKATKSIESYQRVEVTILHDDGEIREFGDSDLLNAAQKDLLRSADYSTNFYISANCQSKNVYTGELQRDSLIYYMTIIPEKEAAYTDGHDALIRYLKDNSRENTAMIKKDQLQPGKVYFTVTKDGTVEQVKLSASSGYPSIDAELIKLVSKIPGKWNPATNWKGEKVDQELVFFFGLEGC